MRMVNFSHDSMTNVITFPIVNFSYLSSNIPESLAYGVFVSQLICYAQFVQNMKIFCSEDLSGFKVIETGIFFTEISDYFSKILWLSYRPCSQIWHLICWMVCSLTVTYDWSTVIFVNHDGCHMWDRKCPLFLEHMISLPLGSLWFYSFVIYIISHWICQF